MTFHIFGYYDTPREPWGWDHHQVPEGTTVEATTARKAVRIYAKSLPETVGYKLYAIAKGGTK